MRKRIADWFEKLSVASLVMALYQDKPLGLWMSGFALALSLVLTWRESK